MKVLIDECAPKALATFLSEHGHECRTVQEAGWAGKQNGELLNLAEAEFDALVTLDTNLRYQQNLSGRKIAIIVVLAKVNRLADLGPLFSRCAVELGRIRPGQVLSVSEPTI